MSNVSTEKLVPNLLLLENPRLSKKVLGFLGIVGFTPLEDSSTWAAGHALESLPVGAAASDDCVLHDGMHTF